MRLVLIGCLLGFTLSACSPHSADQLTGSGTQSSVDLIKAGEGKACSQADVRDALLSEIKPKDSNAGRHDLGNFQAGQNLITYNVDTIAVGGVDKSISSISCDANVVIHYKDHEDKTFSVRYVLRPSVEDPSKFVMNTTIADAKSYAVAVASDAADDIEAARAKERLAQVDAQASREPPASEVGNPSATAENETESNAVRGPDLSSPNAI